MKRVVTINLNGMSFNLDEDAYDELRGYLRRAEAQLVNDPGRTEVIADIERSVAEKCQGFVHAQKNVVTLDEIRSVLVQIGAVEGRAEEPSASFHDPSSGERSRKQLVQIRDGAMVSGVCNGLGPYLGIDVILVRVIFIVLLIATSGGFIVVYAALMFLVPYDTYIEKINDQSLPGFMFKFVTQTKRKVAGTS